MALVEAHLHNKKYLFVNIVKCNVYTCMYRLPPPSPSHLTKSHPCVVLLEAPENAQSHVTFLTICAEQTQQQCRGNKEFLL
jgi:hypothetical protein